MDNIWCEVALFDDNGDNCGCELGLSCCGIKCKHYSCCSIEQQIKMLYRKDAVLKTQYEKHEKELTPIIDSLYKKINDEVLVLKNERDIYNKKQEAFVDCYIGIFTIKGCVDDMDLNVLTYNSNPPTDNKIKKLEALVGEIECRLKKFKQPYDDIHETLLYHHYHDGRD